jgi:uroporphyrinogen-III synthase
MTTRDTTVAVLRPDDGRLAAAAELIEALGATPIADPMLAVDPTGETPRRDADVVVFTSTTGVDLAADAGFDPRANGVESGDAGAESGDVAEADDVVVAAIGETTAARLRERGYAVDVVPETFTSQGLVDALADRVAGVRVEVARSDHGSPVLTDGLEAAGAYVHETVLYELTRPPDSGGSVERAAAGDLDAVCFTSTLTVEHFLDAAIDRGVHDAVLAGLDDAVVGAIGPPTRDAAQSHGITVDVVPDVADFDALATAVVETAAPTYHD